MEHQLLLQHSEWVRRLARSLVLEADRVDEVVQRTWLEALERPPRHRGNLRHWLARVTRNAVRQEHRAETRRSQREQASPAARPVPSTLELVERADLGRYLAQLVVELEEPYRSTLLLRYEEGLEPAEIARRSEVPAATVRSRLKRGLECLRERLDRESGDDRRRWSLALLPLAGGAATTGSVKLLVPAVAVVVLGLALWGGHGIGSSIGPAPGDEAPIAGGGSRIEAAPQDSGSELAGRAAAESADDDVVRVLDRGLGVHGKVFDYWGEPAEGARVLAMPDPEQRALDPDEALVEGVVDAEGGFELRLGDPPGPIALLVLGGDRGRASLRARELEGRTDVGSLTLRPRHFVRGRVVDEAGRPIPDARVRPLFDTGAEIVSWDVVEVDAEGRFALECRAPGGTLDSVAASAPGHAVGLSEGCSCGGEATIVLRPGIPISGRVVDEEGRAVADAEVALDLALHRLTSSYGDFPQDPLQLERTDGDGRFRFDHCAPGRVYFRVRKPGFVVPEVQLDTAETQHVEVKLRAEPPTGVVSGVVRDGRTGQPIAGAWVDDQVQTDAHGNFQIRKLPAFFIHRHRAEFFFRVRAPGYGTREVECPWDGDHRGMELALFPAVTIRGLVLDPEGRPVEMVNVSLRPDTAKAAERGLASPGYGSTRTDADGLFEKQIAAGPYASITVYDSRFADEKILRDFDPEPGSVHGWTFVMGEGRRVGGRVFDADGQAVAGARVSLWWEEDGRWRSRVSTESGWEGSFTLRGFDQARPWLKVVAEGHAPFAVALELPEDPGEVHRVDVHLDAPRRFEGRVRDDAGGPVSDCWIRLRAVAESPLPEVLGEFFVWSADERGVFEREGLPDLPMAVLVRPGKGEAERLGAAVEEVVSPPFPVRDWVLPIQDEAAAGNAVGGGSPGVPRREEGGER